MTRPSLKNDVHCFIYENGPTEIEIIIDNFNEHTPKQVSKALENLKSSKLAVSNGNVWESCIPPKSASSELIAPIVNKPVMQFTERSLSTEIDNLLHNNAVMKKIIGNIESLLSEMDEQLKKG